VYLKQLEEQNDCPEGKQVLQGIESINHAVWDFVVQNSQLGAAVRLLSLTCTSGLEEQH